MQHVAKSLASLLLITRHRHKVIAHCKQAGILWQGLRHDLSKYSPTEFIPGVKYYQGNRSPNEKEREILGYSLAWLHHKGRNRHHFEYWTDYNPVEKKVMPVKMPARFLVEMFCDRLAASKIYKGEQYTDQAPLEYFQNSTARKMDACIQKQNGSSCSYWRFWRKRANQLLLRLPVPC